MIEIILSVLGIAALIAVSFTIGGVATALAVIEKLSDGDD